MTELRDILSRTATLVLAGGRGVRLGALTHTRSKPAVPFGDGRVIDFVLANCLRSNLNHPSIITQYQASHLIQHVGRWWLEQSACGAVASASPRLHAPPSSGVFGDSRRLVQKHVAANSIVPAALGIDNATRSVRVRLAQQAAR